jgi:hypothetical protein
MSKGDGRDDPQRRALMQSIRALIPENSLSSDSDLSTGPEIPVCEHNPGQSDFDKSEGRPPLRDTSQVEKAAVPMDRRPFHSVARTGENVKGIRDTQ